MGKITVRKRYAVRKSKLSKIYGNLSENIGDSADLFRSDRVEIVETTGDAVIYLVDKKLHLMEIEGEIFPTLKGCVEKPFPERHAVVDTGAVAFMAKGADLMRPGIVTATEDIKANKPFVIVDENHKKPLAVGIALMDYAAMIAMESGKVAKNIHYVGDDIWNIEI